MEFFQSGVNVLKLVVIAIGAIYLAMGIMHYLEGYGSDNPGAKSQGAKQFMAGAGVIILGLTLIPKLATLFNV